MRRVFKWIWILVVLSILTTVLLFLGISAEWFGKLPTFEDLENPKTSVATEVISSDGKILGKYYLQNRSYTKYEELSPNLVKALLSTEDVRFKSHSGIDLRGLIRAIAYLGSEGGASTITQQLAKNLFDTRQKLDEKATAQKAFELLPKGETVLAKLKEWLIAVRLEKSYTKKEIMAMYLNTVDFGRNSFGIKSASRYYFNKTVDSLAVQEAAVLVGLLKAPTRYNPVPKANRDKNGTALLRRNTVLEQMERYEYLTQIDCDSIKAIPIELDISKETHTEGLATYFRQYLKSELRIWADENPKADGSLYNIYKDGLRIYTTIDSRMQSLAENAMKKHMSELQAVFFKHWEKYHKEPWNYPKKTTTLDIAIKRSEWYRSYKKSKMTETDWETRLNEKREIRIFTWERGMKDTLLSILDSIKHANKLLHTGMMSMETGTGHIKAWVGGIDIRANQYDHVNKTAKRQVGSTFKPFVYTKAIDNGIQPCERIPNQKIVIEFDDKEWSPENSDGKYGGYYNLFDGLANSVNVIVANLIKRVNPQPVVDLAKRMGVTSQIEAYPSIALGTFDISVYEMVSAYGTFANHGQWVKPIMVTRIEDQRGNVLPMSSNFRPDVREAFDEATAYTMVKLLQGVIDRGTGKRLRRAKYGGIKGSSTFGGKTGTTQDNSDGWFMCFNPDLVTGCWVGADSRAVSFRSTALGQGANMALPMIGLYLRSVFDHDSLGYDELKRFTKPKVPLRVVIDCDDYKGGRQVPVDSTGSNVFDM